MSKSDNRAFQERLKRMGISNLPETIRNNYEVHEWKHACAILEHDFRCEWKDIIDLLKQFRLRKSWIIVGGGRKSPVSEAIDSFLLARGWREKEFETSVKVDENVMDSPTHKIDCYKNRVALEIEWNNFRLLFDLRAISVGVIITRCDELQEVFNNLSRKDSFGASTTHMSKLLPRIEGGGGAGCPLLVFGISKKLYVEDC